MFNLPTLVTITAPTCSGKSHLLEEMMKNGFDRIVSTTDRPARDGEIEGVHYYFISTERSKEIEASGEFAELVTYNGTRYGVTKAEMLLKMSGTKPPIVILEPQGIEAYRKYCGANGYVMFTIYVSTQESVCLERLVDRTTAEIMKVLQNPVGQCAATQKIISINNHRLKAILEEERRWSTSNRWDLYADGTDTVKALAQIMQGVKNRNDRSDIYSYNR